MDAPRAVIDPNATRKKKTGPGKFGKTTARPVEAGNDQRSIALAARAAHHAKIASETLAGPGPAAPFNPPVRGLTPMYFGVA